VQHGLQIIKYFNFIKKLKVETVISLSESLQSIMKDIEKNECKIIDITTLKSIVQLIAKDHYKVLKYLLVADWNEISN